MTSDTTVEIEGAEAEAEAGTLCELPPVPERALPQVLNPNRAAAIVMSDKTWANGTVLHYYFFDRDGDGSFLQFADGSTRFETWVGPETQRQAVRDAFRTWKDLGIGLEFVEVTERDEAEVRIGFMRGNGSWSYVGRDVIDVATDPDERTMNFGWSLLSGHGRDTALHEIGHTIGLPHEHQNPNAGIEWNEEAVFANFEGPPNNWDRDKIRWNILRKLPQNAVQGSKWDPDSIMHYSFAAGLIRKPAEFGGGLFPQRGLSDKDIEWVKRFYPPLEAEVPVLQPFESVRLTLAAGEQLNLRIAPTTTRTYTVQTFGQSDVVMVLFELRDGEPRYLDADDDSGEDYNAKIAARLVRGREYVLRIRLYWANRVGETAVMMF